MYHLKNKEYFLFYINDDRMFIGFKDDRGKYVTVEYIYPSSSTVCIWDSEYEMIKNIRWLPDYINAIQDENLLKKIQNEEIQSDSK